MLADLAEQVARDGEGARKLVEIIVEGATSKASARKIAMSIANSPLVKTAIAGEDANWGRVVMAVGKAGEPANRDKLSISFNGIRVAKSGARDPSYDEAEVSAAMKNPEIPIKVALGLGKGRDRVLTCDLTKEYVAINGDYRVRERLDDRPTASRRSWLHQTHPRRRLRAGRRRQARADRAAAPKARRWRACGNFPAARSSRRAAGSRR